MCPDEPTTDAPLTCDRCGIPLENDNANDREACPYPLDADDPTYYCPFCVPLDDEDEDEETCRECGKDAAPSDRPMKSDPLCWDCYREIYEEES